jgi:EEF1A lysine methyltransferase 4
MAEAESDEALSHPKYWDSRYLKSEGVAPTHEWIRSFTHLEPFFVRNLFLSWRPEENPRILHLGSGDSVCRPI